MGWCHSLRHIKVDLSGSSATRLLTSCRATCATFSRVCEPIMGNFDFVASGHLCDFSQSSEVRAIKNAVAIPLARQP
ncbi:hypothetical protein MLPF_1880 [Mycobacterium lepromatosis]|nr:hypothetical protein MLPF_1880 [Mycobacterium lepromatosis]